MGAAVLYAEHEAGDENAELGGAVFAEKRRRWPVEDLWLGTGGIKDNCVIGKGKEKCWITDWRTGRKTRKMY